MRLIALFFIIVLSVSCGKQTSSNSGESQLADTQSGSCNLNGESIPCATLKTADGQGVDLLESMIDVPVSIQNSEIIFQSDRVNKNLGRRIECGIAIKSGDSFKYALYGNRLSITENGTSYEMQRLNDGNSLMGTWIWKGYVDGGTHMIRQMVVLKNRVILKHSCEL